MNIIWSQRETTVNTVRKQLSDRKLAYTTIATILQRLVDKELLDKKTDGKTSQFFAKISKENYGKVVARGLIKRFIDSFGDVAIASFAQGLEDLPKEKRKYLLKLLK